MKKEVEISALQVGHYVEKIVKQEQQFTLTQAGHIKSELVIKNMIAKGVLSVLIDTNKTIKHQKPITKNNNSSPIIMDVYKAKELFNQSKAIQKKIFSDAQTGKPLDLSPVEQITDETITEIFKNPDALACVINIRNTDEYLLEHSVSVSVLMTIFARFLKIEKSIVQQLSIGAFLHDVGKIMVPEAILNKPGKLTEDEFVTMKTHVNHSIDIIENTPGISALSLEVAALHHEKLDGNGYPFNVAGKDISTYGRMISICDIFDALTANRCYKSGYSHIKAFNILRNLAESNHLDQRLVNLFIKCMGVYPVGSLVELNSNKIAIVEQRNLEDPTNPKVRSFYNSKQHNYVMTEDIDLAKNNDFIVKGVRADDFDLDMNKIIEFLLMEG
ncbi:HD-GYP domain-containing protein [Colwellia sp. 1_MG-2023]|uniref:HD-GYP domain-containing protein n=1 Tax=Colwellia sp. 1_MG-2023 TaxID=3062649 RepID=UPI0026E426CB|nr:HD-GYP domain-containing protein [Colwellia sp. 1_MG-2023]MDO6444758.1 HD-GYP domain-containing protein [Colwellia sp. 1_MG-2023]